MENMLLKMEDRNLKLKNGVSRWKMIQKMILIKHKKEVLQPRILIFNRNQMYSLFHSIRITNNKLESFGYKSNDIEQTNTRLLENRRTKERSECINGTINVDEEHDG